MAQQVKAKTINGVNTEELFKTLEQIKSKPVIAKFKFRVNNEWIDGGHSRTTVKDFYGARAISSGRARRPSNSNAPSLARSASE